MKKLFFFACVLVCITACNSQNKDANDIISNPTLDFKTDPDAVRKLLSENTHIDLDLNELSNQAATRTSIPMDVAVQAKAALYKFYLHVKLQDEFYVCSLKNGSEINISNRLFQALLDNMNEANNAVKKAKEEGVEMKLPPIDAYYLNSLLE